MRAKVTPSAAARRKLFRARVAPNPSSLRGDGAPLLASVLPAADLRERGADETLLDEVREYRLGVLLGRARDCVQRKLRVVRRLVRVVDAREVLYLPLARLPVHALHVARLAHVERRVDEDFDEAVAADQRAALVARRAVRADGRAKNGAAVPRDLRRDEAYAAYVRVAVFLAEAQPLREVRAYHVAVKHRDSPAVLQELDRENLGGRRLA